MDFIEKSAKTVDEAVNEGIKALGVGIEDVDVSVIEQGSKGILGIGAKPAKVKLTVKFDPVKKAKLFLREMCAAMGISAIVDAELKDKNLNIEISGEKMGILIGKRGQTLDAIQYLTSLVVNKGSHPYVSVVVDTENYRQRRKESLENLALNIAKKVKLTKRSVELEPMNPFERRIIHSTLQGDSSINTISRGDEPFRHIVITYKR